MSCYKFETAKSRWGSRSMRSPNGCAALSAVGRTVKKLKPAGLFPASFRRSYYECGVAVKSEGNAAMASNAHAYRQRAAHCLMLAADAHDVSARRRFEALAHSWMKLASDLEMQKFVPQRAAVKSWREFTSSSKRTYWKNRTRRFTPLDG
jgi:hypothetical protein